MIIIELFGGLGNQMFQYACGRRLSYNLNTQLMIDTSWFNKNKQRRYSLDHFNIQAQIATKSALSQTRGNNPYLNKLVSIFPKLKIFLKDNIIREKYYPFDPSVLTLPDNVYLSGYWQSEKYFQDIGKIIKEDFSFKNPPEGRNKRLAEQIQKTYSVSLHVRRGDYASNKGTNEYHGLCSMKYYDKALSLIAQRKKKPYCYIFSDDISWAKKNMKIKYPVTFIDQDGVDKDYEDLRLMIACRHNIIANSSFSWWAAWLNTYAQKIVIAPKRWFKDASIDTSDLIPQSWIKL